MAEGRETRIDCQGGVTAGGECNAIEARLFAHGFLAVLFQQMRRSGPRSRRHAGTRPELDAGVDR